MNNQEAYTLLIKQEAQRLGFDACKVAKADFLEEEATQLEQWLKAGYHGEMQYMENYFDKRLDPRKLVEGAKSVIVLSYNHFPVSQQNPDTFKIAKYAYGEDYHFVIKSKLKELLEFIQSNIGEVNGRAFVDSAPILERAWAEKSGMGWRAKNSLLLQKGKGSYYFLAELILDLNLTIDAPITTNHCGSCTRCIDACPTQAILPNNTVDGSRCISYFTIELKNEIPSQMKGQFVDWIFGCDICQDVCPWNRFSKPTNDSKFLPNEDLLNLRKSDWQELTEEVFKKVFKKSAVKRTKFKGLQRNIEFLSP